MSKHFACLLKQLLSGLFSFSDLRTWNIAASTPHKIEYRQVANYVLIQETSEVIFTFKWAWASALGFNISSNVYLPVCFFILSFLWHKS